MKKSSQKRVKIIYLFWNLHTLKCKEKHCRARAEPGPQWAGGLRPHARAARSSPAPGGRGGSSHGATETRTPPDPVGCGGLRLCVRAARVPPAPSWQMDSGRGRAARSSLAPGYLFWNLHTLKCKGNIYLE